MAYSIASTSDLSSAQDMTAIYNASDLPSSLHDSRTTSTGFKLSDRAFNRWIPSPPPRIRNSQKVSWIWEHGERIAKRADPSDKHSLCRLCWNTKPHIFTTYDIAATSSAAAHIEKVHNITALGPKTVPCKRKSPWDQAQTIEKARVETLNEDEFRGRFIKWITLDDISLRQASSGLLKDLLFYANPIAGDLLYSSHNSVRKLLLDTYHDAKPIIQQILQSAKSRISLSFDGWTSDAGMPLLGICAHFIDSNYTVKQCLLSLQFIEGRHTAEKLAALLKNTIFEYQIQDQIGWFVADNLNTNDKTLIELNKYDGITIDLFEQRLRCLGHVLNLACLALLHGSDADSFETDSKLSLDEVEERARQSQVNLQLSSEQQQLEQWRKKGAIGKAHNFVVHVNRSEQRVQVFKAKQKEVDDSATFLYTLLVNGGIRWNATFTMIERLIKVKDAVTLYQQTEETPPEDTLTPDDWQELVEIKELLEPFKEVTMRTQGYGENGTHGSTWEWLTSIELLLDILETKKTSLLLQEPSHLRTCVNLAWSKLNQYYGYSDRTSIYRAAIVLNPNLKLDWFYDHWQEHHPDWIDDVKAKMASLFASYHARFVPLELEQPLNTRELSRFERFTQPKKKQQVANELERYLATDVSTDIHDLLAWWKAHEGSYPILSQLAFDILGVPAMSAECERLFSAAGRVLNERRARTHHDLAEATQCLRHWLLQGLINLPLPATVRSSERTTPSDSIDI